MTPELPEIKIRPAAPLDAANIARLLKASLETGVASRLVRVDDIRLLQHVTDVLTTSFVAVADVSGRLVGVIALQASKLPWSEDFVLSEVWGYVVPKFLQRGARELLLKTAEDFADERQAIIIVATHMVGSSSVDYDLSKRPGYEKLSSAHIRAPASALSEEANTE